MRSTQPYYRRTFDRVLMVEIEPGLAVNIVSARKLGLVPGGTKFPEPDVLSDAESVEPETFTEH